MLRILTNQRKRVGKIFQVSFRIYLNGWGQEMGAKIEQDIFVIVELFGKVIKSVLSRFKDNPKAERYHGLKVEAARKLMAEDMEKEGLLKKTDDNYEHVVATCYKCGRILEPRILPQWYVRMTEAPKGSKSLRDLAVDVVKKGDVKFVPKNMEKIFMHWMENLRDWNISRQIVWGIRMPIWYKGDEVEIGDESPGEGWERETDVFDTWFSSGQWPFATLKNTNKKDFETFYPTDVMETGHDILFFWVARMIIFGKYVTGEVPFKNVYLHGLVRDKDRVKMSKSKGNVIDPLGVVEDFGADALRMALTVGNTPGSDVIISEQKIKGYRNFANKIWNINRFLMMNIGEHVSLRAPDRSPAQAPRNEAKQSRRDKEILEELDKVIKKVTRDIEKFRFYQAAEDLYHYVWHTFADKIIEEQKLRLEGEEREQAEQLLLHVWSTCLRALHPFMPFVTEACWDTLPIENKKMLIVEKWPS